MINTRVIQCYFPIPEAGFFSKPNTLEGASARNVVKHSKTLGEFRTIYNKGKITITPNLMVVNMHQCLNDVYGLQIQVFRKSG